MFLFSLAPVKFEMGPFSPQKRQPTFLILCLEKKISLAGLFVLCRPRLGLTTGSRSQGLTEDLAVWDQARKGGLFPFHFTATFGS